MCEMQIPFSRKYHLNILFFVRLKLETNKTSFPLGTDVRFAERGQGQRSGS
jgi:hypothetical protein